MPILSEKTEPVKTLIEGIMQRQMVRIRYRKESKEYVSGGGRFTEKGEIVVRTVEPYEIKHDGPKEYFWGYDTTDKTIKRFNLEGIQSARLLPHVFLAGRFG